MVIGKYQQVRIIASYFEFKKLLENGIINVTNGVLKKKLDVDDIFLEEIFNLNQKFKIW